MRNRHGGKRAERTAQKGGIKMEDKIIEALLEKIEEVFTENEKERED